MKRSPLKAPRGPRGHHTLEHAGRIFLRRVFLRILLGVMLTCCGQRSTHEGKSSPTTQKPSPQPRSAQQALANDERRPVEGAPGSGTQRETCGDPAPPPSRELPQVPEPELRFEGPIPGGGNQRLSLRYLGGEEIAYRFEVHGACDRVGEGHARMKDCWWLGAESLLDERGVAVLVPEFVDKKKSRGCWVYIRIDEGSWKRARITETDGCHESCRLPGTQVLRDMGKDPLE